MGQLRLAGGKGKGSQGLWALVTSQGGMLTLEVASGRPTGRAALCTLCRCRVRGGHEALHGAHVGPQLRADGDAGLEEQLAEELAGGKGPRCLVGGGCLSVHREFDGPSFLQAAEIFMAIQGAKKCWTCPVSSRNT